METAESVITDILGEILVGASEQPDQSINFQYVLRNMNRFMAQLDVSGVSLGYTVVTKASDPITIPAGAINGLIFNVAQQVTSSFHMPFSALQVLSAKTGLAAMRKIGVVILPTPLPCTLPIGSGNEGEDTFNTDRFFPCPGDELLTETGGSILLEDGTHNES